MMKKSRIAFLLALAVAPAGCDKDKNDKNDDKKEAKDDPAAKAADDGPAEKPSSMTRKKDKTDKKADKAKPAGKRVASGDDDASGNDKPAPVPAKVDPKAAEPGPAYIAVEGTGLVRIDASGKTKTLIAHDSHFYDLAINPRNGTVYASAIGGLWEVKGDSIGKLPQPDRHRNAEKLAVGPDGVLWSVDHGGVSRWDGKSWTREPAKTFEATLLGDLTVDQGGRVWLTTTEHLWRLEGDKWKRLDNKFAGDKQPFWKMVVTGPSGEVYAVGMAGAFVYEGDAWRKVPLMTDYNHPDEIAVGATGQIAASGGIGNVVVAAPGAAGRPIDMKHGGIVAKQVDAAAVDGNGRAWLKTDNGVVVLDGEGKLLRQLAPGTVPGLNGKIQAIAVAGGGPTLPELTTAAKGTIVGKVIHKGKGLSGVAVEMCASPASFFTKTPCDSAPIAHRATTGADGSFTIPDVLVGAYGFTVKPRSKWLVFWGSSGCCQKIEDGQTYDVGSITLDRLE